MTPAYGDKAISIDTVKGQYNLSKEIAILIDKNNELSFEDILSTKNESKFKQNTLINPNFGISTFGYWVRFSSQNQSNFKEERLLEYNYPLVDHLAFYEQDDNGAWQITKTGDLTPFSTRKINHSSFLFPIVLKPQQKKTYYIYLQTKGSLQIPLSLWDHSSFTEHVYAYQTVLGIYYGIYVVMFFYNLFIFLTTRDLSYLYYILYILCFAFFQSNYNGLLFQFVFPNHPSIVNLIIPVSIGATYFFASLFASHFLRLKSYSKIAERLIRFNLISSFAIVIGSFFLPYDTITRIGTLFGIPFSLNIFIVGILSMKQKYKPASYFTIAWFFFLFGIIILTLKQVGLIPNTFVTTYSIQIGSSLEVILLSLGLGYRISSLMKESKETERKNKIMEAELDSARKIQKSIIPLTIPNTKRLSISLSYLPASKVGGDIFGFNEYSDGTLGVFIADVSGHGIPAALISLMVKQQFDYLSRKYDNPSIVLEQLNYKLYSNVAGHFVTFFYCVIKEDRLLYSNAGHNPPYLLKAKTGELVPLHTKGKAIGVVKFNSIDELEIPFESGDRIILYTDGLIEAGEANMYGEEKLVNFILENQHLPESLFLKKLIGDVQAFIKTKTFTDDLTVLIIDKNADELKHEPTHTHSFMI
jgi:two-component system, sensor histidine kinase LadS